MKLGDWIGIAALGAAAMTLGACGGGADHRGATTSGSGGAEPSASSSGGATSSASTSSSGGAGGASPPARVIDVDASAPFNLTDGGAPWTPKCVGIVARTASDARVAAAPQCVGESILGAHDAWTAAGGRSSMLDKVIADGADCVRLHVSQPSLDPSFGDGTPAEKTAYTKAILDDMGAIRARGLALIVDMQWENNTGFCTHDPNDPKSCPEGCGASQKTFPTYHGSAPGASSTVDAWSALLTAIAGGDLASDRGTLYEIFNEPGDGDDEWPTPATWTEWKSRHQAVLDKIRSFDTEKVVIAEGEHAGKALLPALGDPCTDGGHQGLASLPSGTHAAKCYARSDDAAPGSTPALDDPSKRLVYAFHLMASSAKIPTSSADEIDKAVGDFCVVHPCLATAMGEQDYQPNATGTKCPGDVTKVQLEYLSSFDEPAGRVGLGANLWTWDGPGGPGYTDTTYTVKKSFAGHCGATGVVADKSGCGDEKHPGSGAMHLGFYATGQITCP